MIFEYEGYEVLLAANGPAGLKMAEQEGPDLVFLDIKMPQMDGLEVLKRLKAEEPAPPVVILSGHGTVKTAVEAVKLGAFDYVEKPFEDKAIRRIVTKAVAHFEAAAVHARPADDTQNGRFGLIGTGAAMQEIFNIIDRVADTPSTVLITGESGTGKELVAKALHSQSSRHDQSFIKINCAAIPETLIESELFGHEKGAFTGAVSSKPGRFELADKGTLLLDEIGEIPGPMQVKLLRALQESEFERVGGIKTIHVDVRLVAATNADLSRATEEGRFREDLYYRLNVVPIRIPSLRERQEDIPLLVSHFLKRFNEKLGKNLDALAPDALERLRRHTWPGNIRELENLLERTVLFCDHPIIQVADLPDDLLGTTDHPAVPVAEASAAGTAGSAASEGAAATPETGGVPAREGSEAPSQPVGGSLKEAVKAETVRVEREMIVRALDETGGNVTRAAKLLQISRKSLQIKMKELGLRRVDEASSGSGFGDPPAGSG